MKNPLEIEPKKDRDVKWVKVLMEIPTKSCFCKNCFNLRREASAFCGNCEGERFPIYWNITKEFPLLEEVREAFSISLPMLETLIFTYGDTIYSYRPVSYGLVAHEVMHVLQQTKMGPEKWWKQYLKDPKFRLEQELEAYKRQYEVYRRMDYKNSEELLESIIQDLSSSVYGKMVSFEEAKKLTKE